VQFETIEVELDVHPGVRTPDAVHAVVEAARKSNALLVHTLVSNDLRRVMLAECRRAGVDAMDLMGPVLDRLAHFLRATPQEKPGLFAALEEDRWRSIEAVEFAFRHDDGQRVREMDQAEIILIGVSRTKKTPTCLYLAYRGWFAANVPLVPGVSPTDMLQHIPSDRVFYFTIRPGRLQELRRSRAQHLHIHYDSYADLASIREELRHGDQLCEAFGWRRVDVTGKSVEEISREVLDLMEISASE
jgi:regulator of PEP synthase PpsR (kinase-PPPase family)